MKVLKRNGSTEPFDIDKVRKAVTAAYTSVFVLDQDNVEQVVKKVLYDIVSMDAELVPITVIQSFVENRLIDFGYLHVAASYIEYRLQHDLERYGYGDKIVAKVTLGRVK